MHIVIGSGLHDRLHASATIFLIATKSGLCRHCNGAAHLACSACKSREKDGKAVASGRSIPAVETFWIGAAFRCRE